MALLGGLSKRCGVEEGEDGTSEYVSSSPPVDSFPTSADPAFDDIWGEAPS
jgi:hypothetical protein